VEFLGKSVTELRADEQIYQDAFDKMREIELARSGLAAKYNSVREESRARLEKFLPSHADSVRIVLDLENMARTHKLKLRTVSVTPPSNTSGARPIKKNYEALTASVSVVGDYEKFVPFLSDLEESVRLSDITGVSFESKNEKEYVYGINLQTYQLGSEKSEEN